MKQHFQICVTLSYLSKKKHQYFDYFIRKCAFNTKLFHYLISSLNADITCILSIEYY